MKTNWSVNLKFTYGKKLSEVDLAAIILVKCSKQVSIEIFGFSIWKEVCVHIKEGGSVQLAIRAIFLQKNKIKPT